MSLDHLAFQGVQRHMATAPSLPEPILASTHILKVRVGAALWMVALSAAAAALLRNELSTEPSLDFDRVMESVRRKAVSLRLYGGGPIWLDDDDLSPPIAPLLDDNGQPLERPRWYSVIGPSANDQD
jgi:hypothetical protein